MKRILALVLALLVLPATPVFASASLRRPDAGGTFQERLESAANAYFADATVERVYQEAVLYSPSSAVHTPAGILRPAAKEGQTLAFGDHVTVYGDDACLKIFTVAELSETAPAPEGEEATTVLTQERFEAKTIFFSHASAFSLVSTEEGLCLDLQRGSLSYVHSGAPFGESTFFLQCPVVRLDAAESTLTFGTDAESAAVFCFLSGDPLNIQFGAKTVRLKENTGRAFGEDGVSDVASPLTALGEESAYFAHFYSLIHAMMENSALAAGAVRALAAAEPSSDINQVRENWMAVFEEARLNATSSASASPETQIYALTASRLTLGDLRLDVHAARADAWTLVYPTSTGAYTVFSAGRSLSLFDLSDEEVLTVTVELKIPLSQVGDVLRLRAGEAVFDVTLTQGVSTYLFSPTVGELRAQFADPNEPLHLEIEYNTEGDLLFYTDSAAITFEKPEEGFLPVVADVPITLRLYLSEQRRAGDEFYLIHRTADGNEVRVEPSDSGSGGIYPFTITPGKGVNLVSAELVSLHEISVDDRLDGLFSAELSVADTLLVRSGARPTLRLTPFAQTAFVPGVLQVAGAQTTALEADAFGTYTLMSVHGATTLRLTSAYPVFLPDAELYTIVPMDGFCSSWAQAGGEYRFKVLFSGQAALGTSLLVKNNGVLLNPNEDGEYIIAEVTQPIRLSVSHGVTYQVHLPTAEEYTVSPYGTDSTTVLENGTFRFTVQLNSALNIAQVIVATGETVLTPDEDGVYTISGITQDITLTVRVISVFRVTVSMGDEYSVEAVDGSREEVIAGGKYSFRVRLGAAVHEKSIVKVYANDLELIPDENGVYSVSGILEDVFINVAVRRAYSVVLPDESPFYTVNSEWDYVLSGDDFRFRVHPTSASVLVVRAGGRVLQPEDDEIYTVKNVSGELYLTVEVRSAAEQTHTVVLQQSADVTLTALSSTGVPTGGDFLFSTKVLTDRLFSNQTVRLEVSGATVGEPILTYEDKTGHTISIYRIAGVSRTVTITATLFAN